MDAESEKLILIILAILAVPIAFAAVVAYFWPAVIARRRNHPNFGPIFVVNLLLGWTLVGWVIALAWALATMPIAPPASAAANSQK